MAFVSIKNVFARAALATPEQFDEWSKLWRAAVDAGSGEPLDGALQFVPHQKPPPPLS